jgi:y4mF family transcriptional regulator
MSSTEFSILLKKERRLNHLTQEELALRAGVGLRLIRDIEQGKATLRIDSLNKVLALFGYEVAPVRSSPHAER